MALVRFNDLGRVPPEEREALLGALSGILDSGRLLHGPFSERLEALLSAEVGAPGVTLVGNGTDALRVALMSVGVLQGDRVITVANAGGYTSGVALSIGATPVLVDVDPETAQMDPSSLTRVLESGPKPAAIVVTHLYGQMAPILDIMKIASSYEVPVIEDVAQALGAEIPEGKAGSFGAIAATSFYPTKNLGSIGDAGAVFSSSKELQDRCARLAQYGWGSRYTVEDLSGLNTRMDEIHAATLCHRLAALEDQNLKRRSIFTRIRDAVVRPRQLIGCEDGSFVAHLAVMRTPKRDEDRSSLENAGIESAIHYPVPDHRQPAWQGLLETPVSLANTELLTDQILSLPCFPRMTEVEVDQVVTAVHQLAAV